MSGDLSPERALLGSIWAETLLYGIYATLFCLYLYSMKVHRQPMANKRLVLTTTAIFVLSTAHVVLDFVQVILTPDILASDAVMSQLSDVAPIFEAYVRWDMLDPAVDAIFVTNQVLADGLLIYRCYVVWGSKVWVIVAPVILLLATTCCGYADVVVLSQAYQIRRDWPVSAIEVWPPPHFVYLGDLDINLTTAMLSASLATSVYVTSLIVLRIWRTTREFEISLGRKHGKVFSKALAIIIESGAIWVTCLILWIIVNELTDNASQIPYDCMCQIVGIVPTLMLLRISFCGSSYAASTTTTSGHPVRHLETDMSIQFRPGGGGTMTSGRAMEADEALGTLGELKKTSKHYEGDVELGYIKNVG